MNRTALLGLFFLGTVALAGELPQPPPLKEPALQRYLHRVYDEHNNLKVVTSNPDGSLPGRYMDLIVYNNGGSYKICLNISSGTTGGTTWRCSANALTAP